MAESSSCGDSLECWDYSVELECLKGATDLQLAAELGKTLLERNKSLEQVVRQQQTTIEDQHLEIQYLGRQTDVLRELNESRLRFYEQLESGVQQLEADNSRLKEQLRLQAERARCLADTCEHHDARAAMLQSHVDQLQARLASVQHSPRSHSDHQDHKDHKDHDRRLSGCDQQSHYDSECDVTRGGVAKLDVDSDHDVEGSDVDSVEDGVEDGRDFPATEDNAAQAVRAVRSRLSRLQSLSESLHSLHVHGLPLSPDVTTSNFECDHQGAGRAVDSSIDSAVALDDSLPLNWEMSGGFWTSLIAQLDAHYRRLLDEMDKHECRLLPLGGARCGDAGSQCSRESVSLFDELQQQQQQQHGHFSESAIEHDDSEPACLPLIGCHGNDLSACTASTARSLVSVATQTPPTWPLIGRRRSPSANGGSSGGGGKVYRRLFDDLFHLLKATPAKCDDVISRHQQQATTASPTAATATHAIETAAAVRGDVTEWAEPSVSSDDRQMAPVGGREGSGAAVDHSLAIEQAARLCRLQRSYAETVRIGRARQNGSRTLWH